MEGYLFPGYLHHPERRDGAGYFGRRCWDNFHSRVVVPDGTEAAKLPGGLSAVVTLASLVEREAEVDPDRPLIAAVYWNRLKIGMRLQCDATVQYALPSHRTRLFYADYRVDSPYNTICTRGCRQRRLPVLVFPRLRLPCTLPLSATFFMSPVRRGGTFSARRSRSISRLSPIAGPRGPNSRKSHT